MKHFAVTVFIYVGLVAQRITRLTTDQKIAGSNPAEIESFFFVLELKLFLVNFIDDMNFNLFPTLNFNI